MKKYDEKLQFFDRKQKKLMKNCSFLIKYGDF